MNSAYMADDYRMSVFTIKLPSYDEAIKQSADPPPYEEALKDQTVDQACGRGHERLPHFKVHPWRQHLYRLFCWTVFIVVVILLGWVIFSSINSRW